MLRSLLSAPADQPENLYRGCRAATDALCLDLEDAVPASRKTAARAAAAGFLSSFTGTMPIWVRVNGLDTGLCADDLDAIVDPTLAGIQLPKVETREEIRAVDKMLARRERAAGVGTGRIGVIATLESAAGVRNAFEIASAAERLVALMPATGAGGDLQRDLGYATTADELGLLHVRSRVVLAARAAEIMPLDGVHVDAGLDGFERSAGAARVLGYQGKKIFHHGHLEAANRIFGS